MSATSSSAQECHKEGGGRREEGGGRREEGGGRREEGGGRREEGGGRREEGGGRREEGGGRREEGGGRRGEEGGRRREEGGGVLPGSFLKKETALGFSRSAMYSSCFPLAERWKEPKWTGDGKGSGMSNEVSTRCTECDNHSLSS